MRKALRRETLGSHSLDTSRSQTADSCQKKLLEFHRWAGQREDSDKMAKGDGYDRSVLSFEKLFVCGLEL